MFYTPQATNDINHPLPAMQSWSQRGGTYLEIVHHRRPYPCRTCRCSRASSDTRLANPTLKRMRSCTKILMSLRTNIKIIGCGGGGSNTIDRLYESTSRMPTCMRPTPTPSTCWRSGRHKKILLGRRSTRGLGAGALPQVGEEAAREAEEELRKALQGADIVFVTAGLGRRHRYRFRPLRGPAGQGHGSVDHRDSHLSVQGRGSDPGGERRMGTGEDEGGRRYGHRHPERQAHRARAPATRSTRRSRWPMRS